LKQHGLFWFAAVCLVAGLGCTGSKQDAPGLLDRDGAVDEDTGVPAEPTLDTDGDGVPDRLERFTGDIDSDGDGLFNHEDPDDDGDGLSTRDEGSGDTDGDGMPDYLDDDDDNDGVTTKDELAADGGTGDDDGDGVPNYRDTDRPPPPEEDSGPPPQCAQSEAKADLRKKPVDIVFVVDNSSSMDSEIKAVQRSIDADFAQLIGQSGIDYRVIMLADFGHWDGEARSVCISGALNPGQSCPSLPILDPIYDLAPVNSERFFHYDPDGAEHDQDTSVDSRNSLCRALEWFKKPDGFNLAPQGWSQWLRADAAKVFVEITDDMAQCTVDFDGMGGNDFAVDDLMGDSATWASTFDQVLRTLSAQHFGSDTARNYVFHSIIALPFKVATPDAPYEPAESVQGVKCMSGANPSPTYEALSRLTSGLRFPVCAADAAAENQSLDGFKAVFQRIAQGVVEGSKIVCDFAVPQAPPGETLDRDTVEVVYTPASGDPVSFRKLNDAESCNTMDANFYFAGDTIHLCPSTCSRVQADDQAKVDVRFGCELPPPPPWNEPEDPQDPQ
jgi:hypothetical protein